MKSSRLALVVLGALGAAMLAEACGSGGDAPPAFPVTPGTGDGGSSGSSGTSGGGGTSGSTGTSGGSSGATGTEFCTETFGELFVTTPNRCCSDAEKSDPSFVAAQASFQRAVTDCDQTFDAAVARGRLRIDGSALAACKALIDSQSCASRTTTDISSMCGQILFGLQPSGAPCRMDEECVTGTSCVGYTTTTDGTCGTPAIGAPCGSAPQDGGVEFGSTRTQCAEGGHCLDGTCVAGKPSGASCVSDSDCASPLVCHQNTCGTVGRTGPGTPCDVLQDCALGLYCAMPDGGTTGTCAASLTAGSPCSSLAFGQCLGTCTVSAGTTGTCTQVCGSN